jgi:hypothetical protein
MNEKFIQKKIIHTNKKIFILYLICFIRKKIFFLILKDIFYFKGFIKILLVKLIIF